MKILVPIDFENPITLDKQCNFIAKHYQGDELFLANIIPGFSSAFVGSFFDESNETDLKQEIIDNLENCANKYFTDFDNNLHILTGKRAGQILKFINKKKIDLAVLGCRKKRSRENQRMLGSTTYGVSDMASCSVLIVR